MKLCTIKPREESNIKKENELESWKILGEKNSMASGLSWIVIG